jgi:hypothetical protein
MKNNILKRDYPLSETKMDGDNEKKSSSNVKGAVKTEKPILHRQIIKKEDSKKPDINEGNMKNLREQASKISLDSATRQNLSQGYTEFSKKKK